MQLDQLQQSFISTLRQRGVTVTDEQCAQFETYYRLLVSWNERMNLTGITERKDVYWKHFFDSLTPAFFVKVQTYDRLLDVGSGAGFPGLPLKIVFPHLHLTVIDSLKKRLAFIDEVCEQLQLHDVQTSHGRAEDLGQHKRYRETFDLVTARAVAKLNVLSEYCLPFTRVGGQFIALKSDRALEEEEEAGAAILRLGGRKMVAHHLELPHQLGGRRIIFIAKDKTTPTKYPRRAGIPAKSPLRQ